jgi:hypothetical protein
MSLATDLKSWFSDAVDALINMVMNIGLITPI